MSGEGTAAPPSEGGREARAAADRETQPDSIIRRRARTPWAAAGTPAAMRPVRVCSARRSRGTE